MNLWSAGLLGLTFSSPGEFVFRFPPGTPLVGGLGLRWYGLLMAVAVLVGLILTKALAESRHLEKEPGKASERVELLALWLVISGFLGARLYYVLTHWSEFQDNPLSAFAIWQGGLIIHGGVLAGALALYLYCRTTGINGWKYADVLTPGLILGQAIGRWGNFFNSEAYGAPIPPDSPWPLRVYIPPQAREPEYSQFEFFHPIFFYESVLNLLLFALLMGMFWRFPKLKDGTWVWTYVVGYSLIRIPYEILRVSAVAYLPGTSIKAAYVASGLGLVIGIGMLIYMYRLRFDPDLEQLAAWLSEQAGLAPEAAQKPSGTGLGYSTETSPRRPVGSCHPRHAPLSRHPCPSPVSWLNGSCSCGNCFVAWKAGIPLRKGWPKPVSAVAIRLNQGHSLTPKEKAGPGSKTFRPADLGPANPPPLPSTPTAKWAGESASRQ
jgi:phosphatidylglycerol:prolipoprotein diacylglycerol transferase